MARHVWLWTTTRMLHDTLRPEHLSRLVFRVTIGLREW